MLFLIGYLAAWQDMPLLMLDAYSPTGFRLNNGMRVIGPVAIFPT